MIFLALKQLFTRPQQTFLTFLAIVIGSIGYILFTSIMFGFQEYIIEQLVNSDAQIRISPRDETITEETFKDVFFPNKTIFWIKAPSGKTDNSRLSNIQWWYDKLNKEPGVVAFSTQLVRQVSFIQGRLIYPAKIIGINPEEQTKITNTDKYIVQGEKLKSLNNGDSLAIIGANLKNKMGVRLNDIIQVGIPGKQITPLKIIGIIQTGNRLMDDSICYTSITTLQRITESPGEISDIVVRVTDVSRAKEMSEDWSQFTKDKVESWDQANESIMSVFNTQNIIRNTITVVIILIISFGIYNILNMVVNNKKRDIAILRSIGYEESDIVILFLVQGLILGVTGAIAGSIAGYFLAKFVSTIEVFKGKNLATGTTHLMVSYNIYIYLKGMFLTIIASLISSMIPARAAAKISPIEIIRGS
ncbi:MAG TPA: ABC transporter permease [Leptospiraceae bacterium]|nr:ABC transporter permease [Leptospiraceae bacterium]HMX33956.1 ABC transporter permease [Leptospiraceae bacterium]HMY30872.1 ABC transporter permease [Leptospiraceae bacterium]HMZ62676.1 ABC transporter permease [Leptospiraceae bacterium]HNA08718.1 ABC transporter permease [Leptospiraceae bacterium]